KQVLPSILLEEWVLPHIRAQQPLLSLNVLLLAAQTLLTAGYHSNLRKSCHYKMSHPFYNRNHTVAAYRPNYIPSFEYVSPYSQLLSEMAFHCFCRRTSL